jgi:hypothetical protein
VVVTDVHGRLVYRQQVGRLELPVVLPLDGWSSGAYMVQMIGVKEQVTGKLVAE